MLRGFVPQLKNTPLHEFFRTLSIGYLVFIEDEKKLLFQDAQQKLHSLTKVDFLTDRWNSNEGKKKLPKPFIVNEKEQTIKQYGDRLLYGFINDSDDNIIIFGSLSNLTIKSVDKLLNTNIEGIDDFDKVSEVEDNVKRYYAIHEDGQGSFYFYVEGKEGEEAENTGTGNLVVKIKGTKGNGLAKLETNGIIAINQVKKDGDNEKVVAQLLIDNTEGGEKIEITDQFKNIITVNKDGIKIKATEKINIDTEKEVIINAKESATINSKEAVITGGKLTVKGKATPTGQGAFCAVPNGQCIFSGAPITSDTIEGT